MNDKEPTDLYWPLGPAEHRGIRLDKLPRSFLKWAYSKEFVELQYPEIYEAIEKLLEREDGR